MVGVCLGFAFLLVFSGVFFPRRLSKNCGVGTPTVWWGFCPPPFRTPGFYIETKYVYLIHF